MAMPTASAMSVTESMGSIEFLEEEEELMGGLIDSGFMGDLPLSNAGFDDVPKAKAKKMGRGRGKPAPPKKGTANAARVSRGSLHDKWSGLTQKAPKRDAHQHVTVTCVIYNTVAGGVPSVEDVKAAIEDMEQLYAACGWSGKLADGGADFMKSELTVNDVAKIATKVVTQPFVPEAPVAGDTFPTSGSGGDGVVQGEPVAEKKENKCSVM
jgi:hypothetical protein